LRTFPVEVGPVRPSQVRLRILEDHARLRSLFAELDDVARRVLEGESELAFRLRVLAEALRECFLSHLDLEDAVLVPAVRRADAGGPERAERVAREHREQRHLFQHLLGELSDPERPVEKLASDLRSLVQELYRDMSQEEESILDEDLLRDDVVGIDVEAG